MSTSFRSQPVFSFAFQPIVHVARRMTISFEALVRGPHNESAASVLQQVSAEHIGAFDRQLHRSAIALAAKLGIPCGLNLNLTPSSQIASDEVVQSALAVAQQYGIGPERLTFEMTERDIVRQYDECAQFIKQCRSSGMNISIDDFGSGYAGLNVLSECMPTTIKLDMSLIRNIHMRDSRQAVVRGISKTCGELGIDMIAEGVETIEEYLWCRDEAIDLFQGYFFAKPAFEQLPLVASLWS